MRSSLREPFKSAPESLRFVDGDFKKSPSLISLKKISQLCDNPTVNCMLKKYRLTNIVFEDVLFYRIDYHMNTRIINNNMKRKIPVYFCLLGNKEAPDKRALEDG